MKRLIISTLLSLLFVCCSEGSFVDSGIADGAVEDSIVEELADLVAVGIEGEIATTTRVSETSWDDGDEIGVFMTYFGSDTELEKNICYTTTGDGKFSPSKESDTIYYPNNEATVNFCAYYPYSSSVGSLGEMDLNISSIHQYNQESIDILRGYVEGVRFDEREDQIAFAFEHILSKIDVVIYPGIGYTIASLLGISVSITEQAHSASYVAYTDVLDVDSGSSEITLASGPMTDDDGTLCYSSSAIIFPQTASEDCELCFELDNGDSFTLPLSGEELLAGDNLVINVSINLGGIETISTNIVAWGGSEEHYGTDYDYIPIWNESDLNSYRADVNKGEEVSDAILMSDITLSTTTDWSPIGNDIHPYTATFNGNGKSISGLTILESSSSCQGLFGVVGDGITEAYIYDLTITSPNITSGNSCGAVAGMSNKATLSRCVVDGGVVSGSAYTGGVVGTAVSTLFKYCSSSCTTADGLSVVPLVGSLRDGSSIVD